jgi:hypothetical protein
MESAAVIWKHLRVRSFSTAVLALVFSISGWAQQGTPTSQKHKAKKHAGTIEYRSMRYGFRFTLPESWKGYRVLWSQWEGGVHANDGTVTHIVQGPMFKIRHPKWTEENPREDMPIMIFTIAKWNEQPIVSAAPFGPCELGHNRKYVFAVPPRWNYDFVEGWEEAQETLTSDSLHTFAPAK